MPAKRRSYRTASAFYQDFEGGKWLLSLNLPSHMASPAIRRVLKTKWLEETDFTLSFDHSNIVLMRLELVVDELTEADLDQLLEQPTVNSYGYNQLAGMLQFLQFVQQRRPDHISQTVNDWIAENG